MLTIHDRRPVSFRPQSRDFIYTLEQVREYFPNAVDIKTVSEDPGERYYVVYFNDNYVRMVNGGAVWLNGTSLGSNSETVDIPIGVIQCLGLAGNI